MCKNFSAAAHNAPATNPPSPAKGLDMLRPLYNWMMKQAAKPHAEIILAVISFTEASCFPLPPDIMLAPMVLSRPERAWRYAAVCARGVDPGRLPGLFHRLFSGTDRPGDSQILRPQRRHRRLPQVLRPLGLLHHPGPGHHAHSLQADDHRHRPWRIFRCGNSSWPRASPAPRASCWSLLCARNSAPKS